MIKNTSYSPVSLCNRFIANLSPSQRPDSPCYSDILAYLTNNPSTMLPLRRRVMPNWRSYKPESLSGVSHISFRFALFKRSEVKICMQLVCKSISIEMFNRFTYLIFCDIFCLSWWFYRISPLKWVWIQFLLLSIVLTKSFR